VNAQSDLFIRAVQLLRDKVASFDAYPFNLPAIREFEQLKFSSPLTFFVGENGTGKSTLLEGIAVAAGFNAEGGTRNFRFTSRASHSTLHEFLRLVRGTTRAADGFFLRAESFYNVATEIDGRGVTNSYGGTSLHEQSHGEAFLSLVNHRFSDRGLYILDEPEAALSPARQLALLVRIHDLIATGSQFIIATHSPILMGSPGAEILLFNEDGIAAAAYESTEHYTITRRFLDDREGMLKRLLE
jgi:predicted ATPase